MKKIIFIVLLVLTFTNCEDVIDIDIPSEEPRLIIDALIKVDTSRAFQNVRIKVGLTDAFFGEIAVTGLKQITITNLGINPTFGNPGFVVLLEVEPGVYEKDVGNQFLTEGELILQIDHEDQLYLARTYYVPSVPIDNLTQGAGTSLDGGQTEIITTITDEVERDDFYLFDFDFNEFFLSKDKFYQGQEFQFSYLYDRILQPGEEVEISILGIDRAFFNYMNILIEQSKSNLDLFATPVATVRGNVINVTDIDNIDYFDNVDQTNNFALGYFAVVQEFKKKIVIE